MTDSYFLINSLKSQSEHISQHLISIYLFILVKAENNNFIAL